MLKDNNMNNNNMNDNNTMVNGNNNDINITNNTNNTNNIINNIMNIINNINSLENNFCPPYTQEIINERYKKFVQTSQYKKALEILQKENAVVLVGFSGIGKTWASEMLADFFVKKGYKLKYLSAVNFNNLEFFLSYLNYNIEEFEVIVFDDFLESLVKDGIEKMHYFLEHIKNYKNKKFIFNSTKTSIQDAIAIAKKSNLSYILKEELPTVDFECWEDSKDKLNIFFLWCEQNNIIEQVKKIVFDEIGSSETFYSIFEHRNFSPLIMERATTCCKDKNISEYADTIINCLNHPENIWKEEINALNENSYNYLLTLYSLTDWLADKEIVDECYEKVHVADECLNNIILRLEPLLKKQGNKIGFIHSTLLEYFKSQISAKDRKKILDNITYFEQMERMDCRKETIKKLFTLPVEELKQKLKNLKVLPMSFKFGDENILDVENSINIKYLKYIYDLKIEDEEHQAFLIEVLDDIFKKIEYVLKINNNEEEKEIENALKNMPYLLINSAKDILNVFSLNYDFTKIINNKVCLEMLYSYSDEETIYNLIRLTEEKTENGYDFAKMQDIAQNAIKNVLSAIASNAVEDFIENNCESVIQDYLENEDDDIIASEAASEIVSIIIEDYQDDINECCDNAVIEFLEKYKINNYDLGLFTDINVDCENFIYDFIEEKIDKFLV